MFGFHLDYFICCVISVSGVLIMASSYRRSSQSFANYIVGSGLVVLAALLFFLTDDRALNDYEGGLDANEQAVLFSTGSLTALLLHKGFVELKRRLELF